ncbi:MAG: hypothetical protein H5T62_11465 [Anaerolineae bacterium]|nr:hypothetical protein [Anaerolineae bacterium]
MGLSMTNILHPERYQGAKRRYPYFEGWYYKLVDASEQHRVAVICGTYTGPTPATSHAFVQFMDGITGEVAYYRYLSEDFRTEAGDFEVHIGPNRFRIDRIDLQLEGPDRTVEGSLRFHGVTPWPVRLWSPGVMGWYAWVPFMECYHGVLSLDHSTEGMLRINGTAVDFTGGRGYTEKDWGRRFPVAWVWFQSNHFETPGTSVTASVAIVPWIRSAFRGFIVGLWHAGNLYRFTTYAGGAIEQLAVDPETVEWVLRNRRYRLQMCIRRTEAGLLYAPDLEDMTGRVAETMLSTAEVRLTRLDDPDVQPILAGTARNGALEVVGDINRLTSQVSPALRRNSG